MTHWRRTACAFASVLIMFSTAAAPVRAQDESELKTQNPVADLISVPLQNNINFGVGHMDDVLPNSQAVIPFRLTDECTVSTRTTALLPSKSDAIMGGRECDPSGSDGDRRRLRYLGCLAHRTRADG